jgi:hypothetical protein
MSGKALVVLFYCAVFKIDCVSKYFDDMILRLVHYSFPPILRTIHNSVADGEDAGDSLAAYRNYSGRVYYYIAKTGGGGGQKKH